MTTGRRVVVLGGGVGGLVAASELRRRLSAEDRVTLVDRSERHLFQPSFLWVITGDRRPERIGRRLGRLAGRGIEVIRGEIEAIDPRGLSVRIDGREERADALIVSLGAELAPEAVPGLREGGHDFYTLEGVERLRDALARFRGGRIVLLTAAPAYKCPAAPYEAAMLIEAAFRRRDFRDRAEVHLYAAEPGPMGVAGPDVSAAVRGMVEEKGILYRPGHQVVRVDPAARRIVFANGAEVAYDLLAYVPPHRAPGAVRAAGLVNETGWVPVDRRTLETAHPSIFAVGDVATIPLELGKPLPKAGVFAHRQAEVVARNLARAWTGKGKPAAFDGWGACFVETGDGKAGYGSGDFFAEPVPEVHLRSPSRLWHWGKVLYEKRWLRRWF